MTALQAYYFAFALFFAFIVLKYLFKKEFGYATYYALLSSVALFLGLWNSK